MYFSFSTKKLVNYWMVYLSSQKQVNDHNFFIFAI